MARTKEEEEEHEDKNEMNMMMMDTDKVNYEIFSILESKFLFGYNENISNDRGKVFVLCIDAGGMRGLIPSKALSSLEQSIKQKSGNQNATIAEYFDIAAGTGIGGVLATMLFASNDGETPLAKPQQTTQFIIQNADKILAKPSPPSPPPPTSSSSILRCCFFGAAEDDAVSLSASASATTTAAVSVGHAMKDVFGESLTLRDTLKPLLVPCYDLRSCAPLVFSRVDVVESESFDFRLWEVASATSAEPGRVEPVEMRSVDGATTCIGVDGSVGMMSNPAVAAITHVLYNKQEFPFVRGVEDLMMLSLGCGAASTSVVASDGLRRLHRWGTNAWCGTVERIVADGAADLVDHAVALAFGHCRSSNYVRIQPNLSCLGRSELDVDIDPSTRNVEALMAAAEEMLKQKNVESMLFSGRRITKQTNMEKLDWFAGELVLEHQRRSCRTTPTVAFKQVAQKS